MTATASRATSVRVPFADLQAQTAEVRPALESAWHDLLDTSRFVGGATVETVLTEENVVPGGVVQGEVRIQGGSVDQQIEGLQCAYFAVTSAETACFNNRSCHLP